MYFTHMPTPSPAFIGKRAYKGLCLYQKCVPDFLAGFHHSATGAGTTAEVLPLLRCKEGLSACPLSTLALVLSAREAIPMNFCIFITLVWQNSCFKGGKASMEWVNLFPQMYTESSLHNTASAKPRAAVHRNNSSLWTISSTLNSAYICNLPWHRFRIFPLLLCTLSKVYICMGIIHTTFIIRAAVGSPELYCASNFKAASTQHLFIIIRQGDDH